MKGSQWFIVMIPVPLQQYALIKKGLTMGNRIRVIVVVLAIALLTGCGGASHFPTVTIYESSEQYVKLYHVPVKNHGVQFSHPTTISEEAMRKILEGVMVQEYHGSAPLPLMDSMMEGSRHRAFSDPWINFFAPKLVKGLQQATPEEVVIFFETGQVTSRRQMTTSGGLYVRGDALHIFTSNYHVLTDRWQDNEEYRADFSLTPLDPIEPEPGKLEFEPGEYMVNSDEKDYAKALGKPNLHVGVLYKQLAHAPTSE